MNLSDNPYATPLDSAPPPKRGSVKAPGLILLIVGVIDALAGLVRLGFSLFAGGERAGIDFPEGLSPQMQELAERLIEFVPAIDIVFGVLAIAVGLTIAVGGLQMVRCRSRGFVQFAAVLAMVPCVTFLGCCGVGQGVGLWALLAVSNATNRQLFEEAAKS